MIFKFFANVILISNSELGIKGAAIGNIICNFIVCIVGYIFLIKSIKLKVNIKECILKPIFATLVMIIVSILINFLLKSVIAEKIALIASIASAAIAYGVLVVALKLVKRI